MFAGLGAAGAGASSLGLCSVFSGLCSALSCLFSGCVAACTGIRCCSGASCAGGSNEDWGPGKVGSLLVVVYSVVVSFIFQYGVGDKMQHFSRWTAGGCEDEACLGVQGVFRVNLATVMFFLSNWVGCRLAKRYHNGLWIVKVVVYFAYVAAALFLPAEIIAGYVWVARGGAALFAVLQMVVIIDLAYQVNDWMVEQSDAGSWGAPTTCGLDDNLMLLLGFAFFLFAAALAGIVCLFVFFGDCATTTAFVAMTLVFCVAVTATQLIFSENGNLLTSAAVCAYGVFVGYVAIARNPNDRCNPQLHRHGADWVAVVIGLSLAFVSLVWTTQASSDAVGELLDGGDPAGLGAELVPTKDQPDEEAASEKSGPAAPPPMDCLDGGDRAGARFNLAVALVAMYVACTMTNWGTLLGVSRLGPYLSSRRDDARFG